MTEEPEINLLLATVIVVLCLGLSAFFSAGETAFTAASKARMLGLENAGDVRARIVNRLLAMRERFIGAMLIGNNIVNIGVSAFTTSVLVGVFGNEGVIYATIVMSLLVIVFSEVLPKTLAITSPDRVSLLFARPVSVVVAVLGPLAHLIERLVKLMLRPFGVRLGENDPILSASDELRGQVDLMHKEGGVAKVERDMLGGLLDLRELTVADVMVHRTKMRSINADLSPEEIVREVLASPYTRLPLWREKHENIVGVLHAKDLLRALDAVGGDPNKLKIEAIALETWFVPDTTSLGDQLKAFLNRKTHFALVVDEYGEVQGLVTLEDILEEIVGDIRDEHDVAVQGVRPQPDGAVNVDGSVPIRDLNRAMDWRLPDEWATTIAGLVIHEARMIPDAGQAFTFHGYRFQVLRKARNRITALKITPLGTARPRRAAE
jgi:Mg2+/Co2+ transporter CorB